LVNIPIPKNQEEKILEKAATQFFFGKTKNPYKMNFETST